MYESDYTFKATAAHENISLLNLVNFEGTARLHVYYFAIG